MTNFIKQPGSRIIANQNLNWTGTGTIASTNFSPQTYQIRVASQISGWFSIDATTVAGPTTAGGVGAFVPAATGQAEYFAVTPGQILLWASTSTSTGVGNVVSIQEMS